MERNADHFKDKAERQKIEAEIFLQMKNYVMCIETYFGMLRLNSHIKHFVNMWTEYRQAICIVCNEYVYNHVGLDFKIEYERPIGKGDYKGVNFDPVQLDAVPEDILVNLFCSVYNLRQDLVTDHTQREIMEQAAEIQRTSYNAELEYKYVLALNYKQYPTSQESSYFRTMQEFVSKFVDTCDVVSDSRKYLELLSEEDASIIRGTIKTKLEAAEREHDGQTVPEGEEPRPPALSLVRRRIVHFKMEKVCGRYEALTHEEKFEIVNRLTQTYLWGFALKDQLPDNDKCNLADLVIVACELLYTIRIYDWSVLNPVNFMMLNLLELALSNSYKPAILQEMLSRRGQKGAKPPSELENRMLGTNTTLRIWLMKVQGKLGLTSRYTGIGALVKGVHDEEFEKFGAMKFSHYQNFGAEVELGQTCDRYEKYYSEALTNNRHSMAQGFVEREFGDMNEMLEQNTRLEASNFRVLVKISQTLLNVSRSCSDRAKVVRELSTHANLMDDLCEDERPQRAQKINVTCRHFKPIRWGMKRPILKEEAWIESVYDTKAAKEKKARDEAAEAKDPKALVRVFGYKHPKVTRFLALIMRCLKDCYEQKHD
jgi:hypothetical protein